MLSSNMQVHRKNSSSLIDRLVLTYGCVLLICLAGVQITEALPICYGDLDLIFVLDASYSIIDADFDLVCQFVIRLYGDILDSMGYNVHVAVILYADNPYPDADLIHLTDDQTQVTTRMLDLKRNGRIVSTNTAAGLQRMVQMKEDEGRSTATTVAVFITDGKSSDPESTLAVAAEIQDAGDITVVAIGYGTEESLALSELDAIATRPENSITSTDLLDDDFMYDVLFQVCMATQAMKGPLPVDRASLVIDVIFLLDESLSVLPQDFTISKNFIQTIMNTFEISSSTGRVGIIKFGLQSMASHLIRLNDYTNHADLNDAINNMALNPLNNEQRNLEPAFDRVSELIGVNPDPNRRVIIVVLTTNVADDTADAVAAAKALKERTDINLYILVLAIGRASEARNSETTLIATNAATSFSTDNFLGISGTDDASVEFISRIRNVIHSIGSGTFETTGPGTSTRWSAAVDIVFALDGSTKMRANIEFILVKYIMNQIIDQFELSPTTGRVAIIIYDASGAYSILAFDDTNTRADLLARIDALSLITRTESADNAQGIAAGRAMFEAHQRWPAARILFLVTLSTSPYQLLAEAEARLAALYGIQLIELGIGNHVSMEELTSLQMFDHVDGPVIMTSLANLASDGVISELKADVEYYANTMRTPGRIFPWQTVFDLIFVVHDESGRIGQGDGVKVFLQEVVSSFLIGPNDVRVGVITYGATVHSGVGKRINLGQNQYMGSLIVDILQLSLVPSGGPNLKAALEAAMVMFDQTGSTDGRPRIILQLLEGGFTLDQQLIDIAQQAKDQGIMIASAGIGPGSNQVTTVSFNPKLSFFFPSWTMVDLTPDMSAALMALSLNQYEPQVFDDILRLPDTCTQAVSIWFLFDASDSMTPVFEDLKKFLATLMSGFQMPQVKMGVIGYSSLVLESTIIDLDDYDTYIELYINFMTKMQQDPRFPLTGTDQAIELARRNLTGVTGEKIIVTITDGNSENLELTTEAADNARTEGIKLLAVGVIGQSAPFLQELRAIAGNIQDNVFLVSKNALGDSSMLVPIQARICILARPGDCNVGYYRDPVTYECSACLIGTYQSEPEKLYCDKCPDGTSTSNQASTSDTQCEVNCKPGSFRRGQTCELCAVGYYQPSSGQPKCEKCPDVTPDTLLPGSTSLDDCQTRSGKCTEPMDLALIVDCSASIKAQNFNYVKAFLYYLLDLFEAGTRIALIPIGTETRPEDITPLTDVTNTDVLIDAIVNLPFGADITNTAAAIAMGSQQLDQNGRNDAAPVLLVITDGISIRPAETRYQTLLAQKKGYIMVALGIGTSYFRPELVSIAGDRIIEHENIKTLPYIDISSKLCDAARDYVPPVARTDVCTSKMDIAIVWDLSDSFEAGDVAAIRGLLTNFILSLDLSKIRVAIIGYSSIVHDNPQELTNVLQDLLGAILRQEQLTVGPFTTETALGLLQAMVFLRASNPTVSKVIFLLTDGQSTSPAETVEAAQLVAEAGIFVVCAGINVAASDELSVIASPEADTVLLVDSVYELTVDVIQAKVCPENYACIYELDIIFIWYNNAADDNIAQFSSDLANRFEKVRASIIPVGDDFETQTLADCITKATDMLSTTTTNTIRNIAVNTDRPLSDVVDTAGLQVAVNRARTQGIKITIIRSGSTIDGSDWNPYASSPSLNFHEIQGILIVQRSLCKEPCPSGSEVKSDGSCGPCEVNMYRRKEDSYTCVPCPQGTEALTTGSTSLDDCRLIKKCNIPMDLGYVVDTTDSIQTSEFADLKGFLLDLNTRFDIGLTDLETRVSLFEIGEETTQDDISLPSESISEININLRIIRMSRGALVTNIASALNKLTDTMLNFGRDKKFFPQVALVIIDGTSVNSFQTKLAASRAKGAGIHIAVAAIGPSVSDPEVQAMASDPQSVFKFDTFQELSESDIIADGLCEAARGYEPPEDTDRPPVVILGDCKSNMDIVIVIDASDSISDLTFSIIQIILINFVDRLDIGPQKIRIGILSYGVDVNMDDKFNLADGINKGRVRVAILDQPLRRIGAGTDTAGALDEMIKMFDADIRPGSPLVCILLTDGASDNMVATLEKAQEAKNKGIHLALVGFGSVFKDELYRTATDPASVQIETTIQDLLPEDLLRLSCAHNYTCEAPMDIVVVWDLQEFDMISSTQRFVSDLETRFTSSMLYSVYVDHVSGLHPAVEEAHLTLTTNPSTTLSPMIIIISDKEKEQTEKDSLITLLTTVKQDGILVAFINAVMTPTDLINLPSNNKLYFPTTKFDILPNNLVIKRSLCIKPCPSGQEMVSTGDRCEDCPIGSYKDATMTFQCVTCPSNLITMAPKSTKPEDCLIGDCSSKLDVVFLLDASDSILGYQFNMMLAFLVETIARFDIGLHRVGIVIFSKDVFLRQTFELQWSSDKQKIIDHVLLSLNQENLGYGTNTARGIDVAKDMIIAQGRQDAYPVIVCLTDGASDNTFRTLEEAREAQQHHIRMFGVGLGGRVFVDELRGIASDESSLLFINSFMDLAAKRDFLDEICEDTMFTCGLVMDVVILTDNSASALADADFVKQRIDFVNELTNTALASSAVTSRTFTSHADLSNQLSTLQPSTWGNPQQTKLFVLATKMDLLEDGVQQQLQQIKEGGGIVAVVNANPALADLLFVSAVSNTRLLFTTRKFGENPHLRFIERKLCISPCPSGKERHPNGRCQPCAVGTYRDTSTTRSCTSCNTGYTTVTTGSENSASCVPDCGPGTRSTGTSCVDCAQGFYQPARLQTTCIRCPDGKNTETTKTDMKEKCIADCSAGSKRMPDESGCTECPLNTYQPAPLQASCIFCPGELITDDVSSTSLNDCHDLCGKSMDVLFLVDSSTSISPLEYALIQSFIINNMLRFKVSQVATRFAIITYAYDVLSPEFRFSQSVDIDAAVLAARQTIQGQRDGTNTAAGMEAARQMFAVEGLPDRHQVIILISDGMSDNMQQTIEEASKAKRDIIQIYSLGVGPRAFLSELLAIATDKESVILEPSFMDLVSKNILPIICQADFQCDKSMDIELVKDFDDIPAIETKFNNFKASLDSSFTNSQSSIVTGGSVAASLSSIATTAATNPTLPDFTKIVIIFTYKVNGDVLNSVNAANALKDLGYIVAVVYVSDVKTDRTYDDVVSGPDNLFYAESFDEAPYEDFILTSCCIAPCEDGHQRQLDGSCGPCSKGSTRPASESHVCVDCPPGTTTNTVGSSSAADCIPCAAGEFQCEGQTPVQCFPLDNLCDGTENCANGFDEVCNNCVPGQRWDETLGTCVECQLGFYQFEAKQTSCIQCPEGSTTPTQGSVTVDMCSVKCDEGGKELLFPSGECVECPEDEYKEKGRHIKCVPCRTGTTTAGSTSLSTSIDACLPNCPAGEEFDETIADCVPCSEVEYQPEAKQYDCIHCPAGTATGVLGSTQASDCQNPCGPGRALPPTGFLASDCVDCPLNTYTSGNHTTCQDCQPGFITDTTASLACKPDCPAGEHYSEQQGKCLLCSFGTYQDESNQMECKFCPTGTSNSIQGATNINTCTVPCELGSFLSAAGKCEACPIGSIRNDPADTTCIECDPGFSTETTGSTSCTRNCPAGTRISNGILCVDCEPGTFQPDTGQTSCDDCPAWKSTHAPGADRSDLCTDLCPSGKIMTSRDPLQCSLCAKDTYREQGVDPECMSCPTHKVTDAAGVGRTVLDCKYDCQAGEEFDPVTQACINCPEGEFQNLPKQSECNKCPDGRTTPTPGAMDLSDCVYDCDPGYFWDDSLLDCAPCGIGRFQGASHRDTCDTCPPGTTTLTDTATSETDCVDVCGAGQEVIAGTRTCADCPANTYKMPPTCQPCPAGYISDPASTSVNDCKPKCLKGTYLEPGLEDCVDCSRGTYQELDHQTTCTHCPNERPATLQSASTSQAQCVAPCNAGEHFPHEICEPCPVGFYQPLANQGQCLQCPGGQTSSPGATECVEWECTANEWQCDNGDCIDEALRCDGTQDCADNSDEEGKCDCVMGEYWDTTICAPCAIGTYQDLEDQEFCIQCPLGYYTDTEGSDSFNDCQECDAGSQYLPGATQCTPCPEDQYRPLGQTYCEECPLLHFADPGSDSIDDCLLGCTDGTYFTGTECADCPPGKFQNLSGQRSCFNCPDGTTSPSGSDDSGDCQDPCGAGTYMEYTDRATGSFTCEPCPPDTSKSSTDTTCQSCPVGFASTPQGTSCIPDCGPGTYFQDVTSAVCTPCAVGWHQFEPKKDSCNPCPLGQITVDIGADTIELCFDPCASGWEHDAASSTCVVCVVGEYRERDVDGECTMCPTDKTTKTTGAGSVAECVWDCDAGTYYDETAGACQPCQPGTYQPNKHSTECLDCTPGTFVAATGSTSLSACEDTCERGQELVADGTGLNCKPCDPGWSRDPPDLLCTPCPNGFITLPGSADCVPDCAEGSYYDVDKSSCEKCPQGKYQSDPNKYSCDDCDIGDYTLGTGSTSPLMCIEFCSGGHELQFDGSCKPCEKNYYRTKNVHKQCQSCPGDSITFFVGATGVEFCFWPCPAGSYRDVDDTECIPCPAGSFTDQGYQKQCQQCGTGQTTLDINGTIEVEGATSRSQCRGNCSAGTMWDGVSCIDCPIATHQGDKHKDFCIPCLLGYITPFPASQSVDDCFDPCGNGFTYNMLTSTCEPCGLNFKRNRAENHNLCIDCYPFITLTETATECIPPCTFGEEWEIDVCVECALGFYQDEEHQEDCKPCLDGWTTIETGTISGTLCVPPCTLGQEWDDISKKCVLCTPGTFQDDENQLACKSCGTGETTQLAGSITQADCEATSCSPFEWMCRSQAACGIRCNSIEECNDNSDEGGCSCNPGTYFDGASCKQCDRGEYQDQTGQTACKLCQSWETTPTKGSDSQDDCEDSCDSGYKLSTTGSCEPCPVGTYSVKGSGPDCTECPQGYTSVAAATDPSACVPNCPAGTAFSVSSGSCPPCPIGYSQSETNQKTCNKCPPGTTTSTTGQTTAADCYDPCSDGWELLVGTLPSDCTPCLKGTFKKTGSQATCDTCPFGTTTPGTQSVQPFECLPNCKKGEMVDAALTGCEKCPIGFYQDGLQQLSCKPCESWQSTLFPGSISADDCTVVCGDGLEMSADKTQCIPCSIGQVRNAIIHTECIDCPIPHTTTMAEGSDSIEDCVYNCPAGKMFSVQDSACVDCPIGQFQNLPSQTSCNNCPPWQDTDDEGANDVSLCTDICPGGSELTTDGDCELCARGTTKEEGVDAECIDCRDKWTTLTLGSLPGECVPDCSAGEYWDEQTDSCISCEDNMYNPDPYRIFCMHCPKERPLHVDDHKSCKEDCARGSNWNIITKACNWCNYGSYDVENNNQCVACPLGQTTLNMGETSINACINIPCAASAMYKPATTECVQCNSNTVPSADRLTCSSCPATHPFTTEDGANCMEGCPEGQYWSVQANSCLPCPQDQYQNMPNQEECLPCPTGQMTQTTGSTSVLSCQTEFCAGSQVYNFVTRQCEACTGSQNCGFCPAGSKEVSGVCEPCPKNMYQDQPNQSSCIQCIQSYVTSGIKSTSINDCKISCQKGYRRISRSQCGICPMNTYQDQADQDLCIECIPPLHTDGIGKTRWDDCRAEWCEAGTKKFLFPNGTHECRNCGYGMYRGLQDLVCLACPAGQSTVSPTAASVAECVNVPSCEAGQFSRPQGCVQCPQSTYNSVTGVIRECTPCTPPLITRALGSTSAEDCVLDCPPGQFWTTTNTCDACPVGLYKEGTNSEKACTRCPLNFVTVTTGTTSRSNCQSAICAAGFYYDFGINVCRCCGYSFYRALSDQTCQKCPAGQTTRTKQATSLADCFPIIDTCPSGNKQDPTTRVCTPCGYGFYRNSGLHSDCVPCPWGYSTLFQGSYDASLCFPAVQCDEFCDVMIAVDVTNKTNSAVVFNWLQGLLRRLALDCTKVRVGIISYAQQVTTLASPNECASYTTLVSRLQNGLGSVTASTTNTAGALQRSNNILVTQRRPGLKQYVLLITDNNAPDLTATQAQASALRTNSIDLLYISSNSEEIEAVRPSLNSWYLIVGFNNLPRVDDVVCKFCPNRAWTG